MTQTETTKDRLRLILGEEGLARLDGACVMVIGLGGVGSNCVEALARGGVGNLVLLDRDVVAPSNVNRQAVAYAAPSAAPRPTWRAPWCWTSTPRPASPRSRRFSPRTA